MESATLTRPDTKLELKPDEVVYDGAFVVRETRFGLFKSFALDNLDGEMIVMGALKEAVITTTRWWLKAQQEGWPEDSGRVVNDGVVGGKL